MVRLAADDRPIVIASLFVLVILALGSAYTLATQGNLGFLNPGYLLQQLQAGQEVRLVADPSGLHVFDTESGQRLATAV